MDWKNTDPRKEIKFSKSKGINIIVCRYDEFNAWDVGTCYIRKDSKTIIKHFHPETNDENYMMTSQEKWPENWWWTFNPKHIEKKI